jgi:hypothetical protein
MAGRTFGLVASVIPNSMSFQIQVNWNRNAATIALRTSGRWIETNMRSQLAPSSDAASCISRGTVVM